jgi:CAP-Gly domain-containing linker protein 1
MLPPPSPRLSDSRHAPDGWPLENKAAEINFNSRALQEQIDKLRSSIQTPSSPSTRGASSPLPSTAQPTPTRLSLEKYKAQVKSLELEVEELRSEKAVLEATLLRRDTSSSAGLNGLTHVAATEDLEPILAELSNAKSERDATITQNKLLQQQIDSLNSIMHQKQTAIEENASREESLASQVASQDNDLKEKTSRLLELETKLKESETKCAEAEILARENSELVKTLKEAVAAKTSKEDETAAVVNAKDMEIAQLEARLKRDLLEANEQTRELTRQVDELRLAGQVCHAFQASQPC